MVKVIKNYLWLDGENIRIEFTDKDRKFVRETSAGLKEAIKFLSEYFHLEKSFPSIRAVLAPDRKQYDHLVKELLGVDIEKPSRPSRIAQTQHTDLVLLAPSAYSRDSIYKYFPDEFKRLIFHETTHIFEEYLSPNMEVLPRWWTEGLAVYLSNQWEYEDEFRVPVLEGLKNKKIPNLGRIQGNVKLSYQWGWTIVKYIEYCYGQKTILNIVRNCMDGDVLKMVEETATNFEKRWKKYLKDEKSNHCFAKSG